MSGSPAHNFGKPLTIWAEVFHGLIAAGENISYLPEIILWELQQQQKGIKSLDQWQMNTAAKSQLLHWLSFSAFWCIAEH